MTPADDIETLRRLCRCFGLEKLGVVSLTVRAAVEESPSVTVEFYPSEDDLGPVTRVFRLCRLEPDLPAAPALTDPSGTPGE